MNLSSQSNSFDTNSANSMSTFHSARVESGTLDTSMERTHGHMNHGSSQTSLLDPLKQPKFVNSLPIPDVIDARKGGKYKLDVRETDQWLGLYSGPGKDGIYGTKDDQTLETTIWGYGKNAKVTYPGPTFLTQSGVPIEVEYDNKLPQGKKGGHLLPVDTSIDIAMPMRRTIEQGAIPIVTHLHGGRTESASDGLPEAWYTQNYGETGPDFVKKTHRYDNNQQAATLWYHDHTMGLTRLNVYAGLAGFYLNRDRTLDTLFNKNVLPSGSYEVNLALQDRSFTADGQLYFPSEPDPETPRAPNPSALPEFFGDFNLVNGMAWPKLEVEPRKYLFNLLNGSDSRFYVLDFADASGNPLNGEFVQVGSDQGLLEKAINLDQVVIAPGERANIVLDFSKYQGQTLTLRNFGPDEPFQGLAAIEEAANPNTTGQVMQFMVNQPVAKNVAQATVQTGTPLTQIERLDAKKAAQTRQLVLFEGEDQFDRIQPRLGTVADGSLLYDDPITEKPKLGTSEIWEFYNTTADAHPIHVHLVEFEVLDRQGFTADVVETGTNSMGGTKQVVRNISLTGNPTPPAPNDAGWKDTVIVNPGERVRVIAEFNRPGEYVWHCHILSHEDNEMMRPYEVVA
jgi:spore coat protein A, manganese oxidase